MNTLLKRKKYLLLTPLALLVATIGATLVQQTSKATVQGWNAGYIISDSTFANKNTMSANDIQIFLNSKVPTCDTWGEQTSEYGGGTRRQWAEAHGYSAPFTCMRDYSENGKSAAQIIYEAAQTYSINPQVLLVLLQKEQGLVTDTWPLSIQYRSATGYGCPDSAACDSQYYGLTNQLQWAAKMFRAILNDSPTWYTPYVLGDNYIKYNPDSSCGGTNVYIQNRATQALYNYTPYQPNQGALDADWGTAPCGSYGNRNFYLYFTSWFGSTTSDPFILLNNPRWMVAATDTQKKNPWTGELSETFPTNTQFHFVDKININGDWYLRTEYDRAHGIDRGVPQADVAEIQFQPLDTPRYMELSKNANKINPRNWVSNLGQTFSAGTTFKFTSKMFVNGVWFYRTEYSDTNDDSSAFYANSVREITYKNFDTPRYMHIKNATHKTDPVRGTVDGTTINAGTELQFNSKVYVGGIWYYRTTQDTSAETLLAIPSGDIEEVPYQALTPPKWLQTKTATQKTHPASGTLTGNTIPQGTKVRITQQITVNGVAYYRTDYDATSNLDKAMPVSNFEEIPYQALENPRQLTVKTATKKVNPKTGVEVDSTISSGTSLMFTTKIDIGGVWYLRTESDSTGSLDKAIPLSKLSEATS
ncbi:MAG TPA: hypothetical protein VLG09_05690 [Candidatus Saccharimonadales bacterium]|nr:hypothetical protein [Candidatus Saccharimonadales bacterium]